MKHLVFAVTLFLMVPALHAQKTEARGSATEDQPQAASQAQPDPQPAAQNPNTQSTLPASIRPGHPLDPADVDILTGKRDREMEAARQAAVSSTAGAYVGYGYYGDAYLMSGRRGFGWDLPELPLARIANPFFFGRFSSRSFGRGGFHRGR